MVRDVEWFRRRRPVRAKPADFAWQRPEGDGDGGLRVACLVRTGLLVDELRMFEHAFATEEVVATFVNVGPAAGRVSGVHGAVTADLSFADDPGRADIVLVPGAIGTAAATTDHELIGWLVRAANTARWVIASSTGSVVLAATGALEGSEAATHWLAKDSLMQYQARPTVDRVAIHGNVITCSGEATIPLAVHHALHAVPAETVTIDAGRARRSADPDLAWRRPAG